MMAGFMTDILTTYLDRQLIEHYFDFNATSPVRTSVKNWLVSEGLNHFANSSSPYQLGRKQRFNIKLQEEFLLNTWKLSEQWKVWFHSGATEAANVLTKGLFVHALMTKRPFIYIYGAGDHSCWYQQAEWLRERGALVFEIPMNVHGEHDYEKFKQFIEQSQENISSLLLSQNKPMIVASFNRVNNETGVVQESKVFIQHIKKCIELVLDQYQFNASFEQLTWGEDIILHVDEVQSPGKKISWREDIALDQEKFHVYTFSGHKIGALKGVGWSFVHPQTYEVFPEFFHGGGQQKHLRSGTMNVMGIMSLQLALTELIAIDLLPTEVFRKRIESFFKKHFSDQIFINGSAAGERISNTLNIGFKGQKSDILCTLFDLQGMQVAQGSACSSGSSRPSRVLLKMGLPPECAKSALRLSFAPECNEVNYPGISETIEQQCLQALKKFLSFSEGKS